MSDEEKGMSGRCARRYASCLWFFELVLVLLLFSHCLTLAYCVELAGATVVSVSPSSIVASTSQDFNIDVMVNDVTDLYGWEFRLAWDATLLDVVNAAEGQFLENHGSTYFTYNVNASIGRMAVDCTLLGEVLGASGSGLLATVTFHVKSVGQCLLDLCNVTLLNYLELAIECEVSDGYGTFTYPHDVAVTEVKATPLIALPSEIVNVNVTVLNEGGYTEGFNVTAYANAALIGTQCVSLTSRLSTVVQFDWDTAGFFKGEYEISAQASIVANETDVSDNSVAADDKVTLLYAGHDIAIIIVEPVKTAVGKGYTEIIEVTVKDFGIFTETFDVTAYVNAMPIGTQTLMLGSGDSVKLSFSWATTDYAIADYSTSATAMAVLGETYVADNTLNGSDFAVTIPGDVDGDFGVDVLDVVKITGIYASERGDLIFSPNSDIDDDGSITIIDVVICTSHYGQKWP